jgi:hypothetical protein
MPVFGFSNWHFRRGEALWSIMHNMLNFHAQANALPSARPNLIHLCSTLICNGFWASHAPVQAHAWRTQLHMHTSFLLPCISCGYK